MQVQALATTLICNVLNEMSMGITKGTYQTTYC